jgi:hypothetical protein
MESGIMRLRAGNHGASAAAKSFTVAVMTAAMVAQLLSISHEMTVRHFRCAEHGELTHVASLSAPPAELPAQRTDDALRARDGEATDTHEHCGVTFVVQGSSCMTSIGVAIGALPPSPAPVLRPAPSSVSWRARAFVLASAPKTSPPSA